MGVSGEGRGGSFGGRRVFCIGRAGLFAGKPAPTGDRGGAWIVESQMQQNPHLAGFVLLRIWWSRGDLNPRPPVLRCRYYMRSRVY